MRCLVILSIVLTVLCNSYQHLSAQTVVANRNIQVVPDFGDITSVWFEYDGTNLTGLSLNLDEGSDWYLVNEGDSFGFTELAIDQFTPIIRVHNDSGGVDLLTAEVGVGEFYMGVATSGGGLALPCPPGTISCRNVFGWIKLRGEQVFDFQKSEFTGSLQMISSAVAYESSGIVVGSSQAITDTIHSPFPPDFNRDGWSNGADLVVWQRGASPNSLSAWDLSVWETRFGERNTPGRTTVVPEPVFTASLIMLISSACQFRGKGRSIRPARGRTLTTGPDLSSQGAAYIDNTDDDPVSNFSSQGSRL